jgi:HK97 family phage prohead protease
MTKNNNIITRACFQCEGLEVREEGDKRMIRGYASVFEKLSVPIYDFKEKIRSGAFANSLKNNNVRALWNHNSDFVLGSTKAGTLRLSEDDKGLHFELDLPDTQTGRDAYTTIKRGDVDGMSFGFRVKRQEWDEKDRKNIVRTLIEVDLREISPTPFPAYPDTKVKARTIEEDYADHTEENNATERERRVNELNLQKQKLLILEREDV